MFGLTGTEWAMGGGMLLLAWMLLSRGGVGTFKLMAFAGGVFLVMALGLKEGMGWLG